MSNQHGTYTQGNTHPTMASDRGQPSRKAELIPKPFLSSDCSLKPESMKSDLVVIAGQQTAVNPFPFLVRTARQMRKAGSARSGPARGN